MQKNMVRLEEKIEDRTHEYNCDPKCSLGEIYDVLCKMLGYIVNRMQEMSPKPREELEDKKDEPKEDDALREV